MSALAKKKSQQPLQNVKVMVRIRPLNKQEQEQQVKNVIKVNTHKELLLKEKKYSFDSIFTTTATQMEMYINVVAPLIHDVVAGYNCTVFAYGQTGSGKTFTMTGDKCSTSGHWRQDDDAGIIPRAAQHIFDELAKLPQVEANVRISYIELYNEEIRDLLSDEDGTLNLYTDVKGTLFIQGVKEISVPDSQGVVKMLQRGILKRQVAPTLMNHQSSRSHTVFTMSVNTRENTVGGEDILKAGKINLVDLAGSENIARAGCKDLRATELANINRSLLTLGRVIHALADKSLKHVPYRDSKLTRILQDSLGGNTKTVIIATVSPANSSQEETSSTLEYATRARDIKNTPTVNEKLTKHAMIDGLVKEIDRLQKDLDAARSCTGFYVNKDNYQKMLDAIMVVTGNQMTAAELEGMKVDRIHNLEQIMQTKVRQFEDTVRQCKEHQEELSRIKSAIQVKDEILEQEKFLSKWYENHSNEKLMEANRLLNTMDILRNEKEILLAKLENQFTINVENENVTQNAVNRLLRVVDEFEHDEKIRAVIHQKGISHLECAIWDHKTKLEKSLRSLKHVYPSVDTETAINFSFSEAVNPFVKGHSCVILKKLEALEKVLLNYDNHIGCFGSNVRQMSDMYNSTTRMFFTKTSEMLRNNPLGSHNSMVLNKLSSVEKVLLECKHQKENMVKEYQFMIASANADLEKTDFVLSTIDTIKKDVMSFEDQINDETQQKLRELESVCMDSIKNFETQVNNFPQVARISGQEVEEVLSSVKEFVKKLEALSSDLDASNKKITVETLEYISQFLESSYEEIEKTLDGEVQFLVQNVGNMVETTESFISSFDSLMAYVKDTLVHEILTKNKKAKHIGDTPQRQSVEVPRIIREFAPRDVLIRKFKETKLPVTNEKEEDDENLSPNKIQ